MIKVDCQFNRQFVSENSYTLANIPDLDRSRPPDFRREIEVLAEGTSCQDQARYDYKAVGKFIHNLD